MNDVADLVRHEGNELSDHMTGTTDPDQRGPSRPWNNAVTAVSGVLAPVTALYLLLPALLFALGWLRPAIATVVGSLITLSACALIADLLGSLRRFRTGALPCGLSSTPLRAAVASAGLVIVLWVSLSGVGGVGHQNDDYRASNALLKDLIEQPWPLRMTIDGTIRPVVYYVGYFLPAAAVGKVAGWYVANAVIFTWTALGTLLATAWFLFLTNAPARLWWLVALLFSFAGGLDALGYHLLTRHAFHLSNHVQWWADYFQYSSNTTLLYWVPQHAIAAWLMISLVWHSLRNPASASVTAVSLAAAILWSPFGVLGVIPFTFLASFGWAKGALRRELRLPANRLMFGTALVVAAVHGAFLYANSFSFPIGFAWDGRPFGRVARHLFAFWCLEFGLLAAVIVLFVATAIGTGGRTDIPVDVGGKHWRRTVTRAFGCDPSCVGIFGTAIGVLTMLPVFKMGWSNDLVMRGSIPALFVFWTCVAAILMQVRSRRGSLSRGAYLAIVIIVIIGGFPAVSEISRSIRGFRLGPPPIDSVATTASIRENDRLQRTGCDDSLFFRALAR